MAKILFVEDDKSISESVSESLRQQRHVVDAVSSFTDGMEFLRVYTYDLAIFDWQLPDGAGVDLCRSMRQNHIRTPVLILTGKDTVLDKTTGLDSGADDYLTKPFVFEELSARIRALLRRDFTQQAELLQFEDLILDDLGHNVHIQGKSTPIKLRPREFTLLECLVSAQGKVVSHQTLRNKVWWDEPGVERNTINAMVARLRKRLEECGSAVKLVAIAGEGVQISS